jgi:hypothetical protein
MYNSIAVSWYEEQCHYGANWISRRSTTLLGSYDLVYPQSHFQYPKLLISAIAECLVRLSKYQSALRFVLGLQGRVQNDDIMNLVGCLGCVVGLRYIHSPVTRLGRQNILLGISPSPYCVWHRSSRLSWVESRQFPCFPVCQFQVHERSR